MQARPRVRRERVTLTSLDDRESADVTHQIRPGSQVGSDALDAKLLQADAGGQLTERYGEIGARLNASTHMLIPTQLAQIWFRGVATWRLRGLAPLAPDAGLPGRIRGAFGQRLAAGASPEALRDLPCLWSPPCAFEALWRKQGRLAAGFDHASPWVIGIDPHRGDLDVTLTLFGFANDWLPAAVEAMTAALVHDVDWAGQTRLFVPRIEIADRHVTEFEGVEIPPAASGFVLTFVAPLALSGADPRDRPASLITGLGQRLEALARWHDATLNGAFDRTALAPLAHALDYAFYDSEIVTWTRGSRKQDRAIPMRGLTGALAISGSATENHLTGVLLALGATCHMGADAAFGCGRYVLAPMM